MARCRTCCSMRSALGSWRPWDYGSRRRGDSEHRPPCERSFLMRIIGVPAMQFAFQTPPAAAANTGLGLAWAIMILMLAALVYVLVTAVQLSRGADWPAPPLWTAKL